MDTSEFLTLDNFSPEPEPEPEEPDLSAYDDVISRHSGGPGIEYGIIEQCMQNCGPLSHCSRDNGYFEENYKIPVDTYEINPIHIDMRFTFSNQDNDLKCLQDKSFISRCKSIHRAIINYMLDGGYIFECKYTSGFETLNKAGENVRAHIHVRFQTTTVTSNLRRRIKEFIERTFDESTKGNPAFMFKTLCVRSYSDFYQYPLKSCGTNHICNGFSDTELEILQTSAIAYFNKTVQVRQNKMDKADASNTRFEKALENCKKLNADTIRKCQLILIQLYKEENGSINQTTIIGYANNIALQLGIITPEELLDKWGY